MITLVNNVSIIIIFLSLFPYDWHLVLKMMKLLNQQPAEQDSCQEFMIEMIPCHATSAE